MRILSLIASSSSARPPRGAPGAQRHSPGPPRSLGNQSRLPEARQRARPCSNTRMACSRSPWARYRWPRQAWAAIGVCPRPSSVARRSASSPWRLALGEGPERAQGPRQPRLGLDPHSLYWACQTPCPQPPRSAAAARPPGRSRRWHSMPAPGNRILAPARRSRRARPRARGPAGPPPWRRRGLPSA